MSKFVKGARVRFQTSTGTIVEALELSKEEKAVPHYKVALDRLGQAPEEHDIAEPNLEAIE